MAKQTFLYELLIRLGPDGFVGSHAVDLVRHTDDDDGELILERETAPRAITQAEATTLLGAQNGPLLVQLQSLTDQLAAETLRADQAEAALADALARAELAETALAASPKPDAAPAEPQAEEA